MAKLAAPGGNLTGLSLQTPACRQTARAVARIQPGFRCLVNLANIGYPAAVLEMNEVPAMARAAAVDVSRLEIERAEDLVRAFARADVRADALYVCTDPLMNTARTEVNALAHRTPANGSQEEAVCRNRGPRLVRTGGVRLFRHAAEYVDKMAAAHSQANSR
jgi:putative ABC transport system substrate-binding protein